MRRRNQGFLTKNPKPGALQTPQIQVGPPPQTAPSTPVADMGGPPTITLVLMVLDKGTGQLMPLPFDSTTKGIKVVLEVTP